MTDTVTFQNGHGPSRMFGWRLGGAIVGLGGSAIVVALWVWTAIDTLVDGPSSSGSMTFPVAVIGYTVAIGIVGLAIWFGTELKPQRIGFTLPAKPVRVSLTVMGLLFGGAIITEWAISQIMAKIGASDIDDTSGTGVWGTLMNGVRGGSEEIFVQAALLMTALFLLDIAAGSHHRGWQRFAAYLRSGKVGVVGFVVVDTAVRLSYHVYYGWGALELLPWAVGAAYLYVRHRSWLIPMIACHILYNWIVAYIPNDSKSFTIAAGIGLVAAVAAGIYYRRQLSPHDSARES